MESRAAVRIVRDRIIVIIFSLTLLSIFTVLAVRRRSQRMEVAPPRPIYVSTVVPEKKDISRTLRFSSTLDAESSVSILPRVSGTITELFVEEASVVAPGDLLARIDPEPYRLEMMAAESAWLLAESSYTRIERLHSGSGASRQQLDEAVANRDAARSSFELTRMQYEYSEVRAPVGGIVLSRFAEEGSLAMPGQPLFLIGNDGSYRVEVRIPEKHWPEFSDPDRIRVAVGLPAMSEEGYVPAEILRLSPSISPADRTFRVTCSIGHSQINWPLGSRLSTVFILEEQENTWTLPLKTVGGDSTLWWVDIGDSTAHRLELPDGIQDTHLVKIPDSWSGRTFVLDGQHRLRENMIVAAVPEETESRW